MVLTLLFPYVNNKAVSIFSSCLTMTLFDWTHDVLYQITIHALTFTHLLAQLKTLVQWHLLVTARGWLHKAARRGSLVYATVFPHLYALLIVSLVLGLSSCSQDICSRSAVRASDTLYRVYHAL